MIREKFGGKFYFFGLSKRSLADSDTAQVWPVTGFWYVVGRPSERVSGLTCL